MFDETKHAGQRIFDRSRTIFVNFATHSNGIGHVAPAGRTRLFKFAQQERFLRALGKEHVNRFEMRAGHRENMGGAID